APTCAVENAVVADALLDIVESIISRHGGTQVVGRFGLTKPRDVVAFALNGEQGCAPDLAAIHALSPVRQRALRQPVVLEDGLDGMQIELSGEIHYGQILFVELPVLADRVAVTL